MTEQILLRCATKVKYLNIAVSLDRYPSPGSHWLGHLPSLVNPAYPAHFACSQVFIECYMDMYLTLLGHLNKVLVGHLKLVM